MTSIHRLSIQSNHVNRAAAKKLPYYLDASRMGRNKSHTDDLGVKYFNKNSIRLRNALGFLVQSL